MIKNFIYKLLRKSEKYTKTDMVYLAKGGFWLVAINIITIVISFVSAILFANLLTKNDYGTYKYILSILNIIYITSLPGLGTAIAQSYANDKKIRLSKIAHTKIKWGILGSIVCILAGLYYLNIKNYTLAYSLLASSILIPFINTFNIYGAFLQGIKKFDLFAKYKIIAQIIGSIAIIIALLLTKNILIILMANLCTYLLVRYYIYKKTIKQNPVTLDHNIKYNEKNVISYGKKMSIVNIINTIADNLDQIIIFKFLGPENLAIYAIALAPIQHIKRVLLNIKTLSLPKFAATDIQLIKENIKNKIIKTYIIIIPIIIIYVLAAPFLFKLFFNEYQKSILITQLLSITIIFMPRAILGAALESKKRAKSLFTSKTTSSIIKISSLLILINYFDIFGIVIALMIYEFSIFILFYKNIQKL